MFNCIFILLAAGLVWADLPANDKVLKGMLLGNSAEQEIRLSKIQQEIKSYAKEKELLARMQLTIKAIDTLLFEIRKSSAKEEAKANPLEKISKVMSDAKTVISPNSVKDKDRKIFDDMYALYLWGEKLFLEEIAKIPKIKMDQMTNKMTYSAARAAGRFVPLALMSKSSGTCDEAQIKLAYENVIKQNEDQFLKNWYIIYVAIYNEMLEKENYPQYRKQLINYFEETNHRYKGVLKLLAEHYFSDGLHESRLANLDKLNEIKSRYVKSKKAFDSSAIESMARQIGSSAPFCVGFGFSMQGAKQFGNLRQKLAALKFLKIIRESPMNNKAIVRSYEFATELPVMGTFAILDGDKYKTFFESQESGRTYNVVKEGDTVFPLVTEVISSDEYNKMKDTP